MVLTPEQEERRGQQAREWLGNEIYKETFPQITNNIMALLARQSTSKEQADELRYLLIALGKIKMIIEQVATTGTMAAMETERKRTFLERQAERFSRRA
jgi:hypothetical protein